MLAPASVQQGQYAAAVLLENRKFRHMVFDRRPELRALTIAQAIFFPPAAFFSPGCRWIFENTRPLTSSEVLNV